MFLKKFKISLFILLGAFFLTPLKSIQLEKLNLTLNSFKNTDSETPKEFIRFFGERTFYYL